MRLIMINEGRKQVYNFFVKNGIKPSEAVFDLECFEDVEPFITEEDVILVVVHGFTDFHNAGIVQLLGKMSDNDNIQYDNVIILSDIKLKGVEHEYYLYEGNPFKSELQVVRGNTVLTEKEVLSKEKDIVAKRGVIEKIKLYNSKDKCLIFENADNKKKGVLRDNEADDSTYGCIKIVDIFKNIEDK